MADYALAVTLCHLGTLGLRPRCPSVHFRAPLNVRASWFFSHTCGPLQMHSRWYNGVDSVCVKTTAMLSAGPG